MEGKELRVVVTREEKAAEAGDDEPVSPTGLYFNSSALSISILAFFEFDCPIDDSPTMDTLEKEFLPINPRFSSIMVRDEHGEALWKRVKVKLEDHVYIPMFPAGLNFYDEYLQDYVSKISMEQLPQSRPLWSLHLIKYPTKNAEGTMIFKLHHSLGDGFSLMGAIFSCIKRYDDPSKPLTFPAPAASKPQVKHKRAASAFSAVPRALSVTVNTVRHFGWSLLKSSLLQDDQTPVRSGNPGVEFQPLEMSSVSFSLDDIKKIKYKTGGTINDVISGIIFYGIRLYMHASDQAKKGDRVTALVLLNTRIVQSYQTVAEMTRPNAKSPWGNQFGFLHVGLPLCKDIDKADPITFIKKARNIIRAKRSSLAVHLTARMLDFMRKLRGPEVTAKYIHATLKNTSMAISNLTGPMEQMGIAGHAVRSLYFMVVGVPQSMTIAVVSYMGKLKVAFGTEKGFIDSDLLISCMEKSFRNIFDAAVGEQH